MAFVSLSGFLFKTFPLHKTLSARIKPSWPDFVNYQDQNTCCNSFVSIDENEVKDLVQCWNDVERIPNSYSILDLAMTAKYLLTFSSKLFINIDRDQFTIRR